MTPTLVGRFSSLDRRFSAFGGVTGCGVLPVSDLSDFVGDAGGLGSTARTPLTQLSREGNRKPPGGDGGSPVVGYVGTFERGGDCTGYDVMLIGILFRRGGRGGTGGTDEGTAGRGPVGGGRGSGGGVNDRDIARLRDRGGIPKVDADSTCEGEAASRKTAEMRKLGGVEGSTRGEVSGLDRPIVGNVGDEPRATVDVGDEVHIETVDSVSEGTYGVAPTAGHSAKASIFRNGTTSDRRCERPLCTCNGVSGASAVCGPNDDTRGVGSSSAVSGSLFAKECEVSVPSRDVRF